MIQKGSILRGLTVEEMQALPNQRLLNKSAVDVQEEIANKTVIVESIHINSDNGGGPPAQMVETKFLSTGKRFHRRVNAVRFKEL